MSEVVIGIRKQTREALNELRFDARVRTMDELINVLMSEYLKNHVDAKKMTKVAVKVGYKTVIAPMNKEVPKPSLTEKYKTQASLAKKIAELALELKSLDELRESSEAKATPAAADPANLNPGEAV